MSSKVRVELALELCTQNASRSQLNHINHLAGAETGIQPELGPFNWLGLDQSRYTAVCADAVQQFKNPTQTNFGLDEYDTNLTFVYDTFFKV